jgi:NAD(P)-dependent dehydrogenase (short-subunit alcohol dehydrogenase family)
MHGFTKSLALEVARKGVTVNTISPGYIGTKMVMAIPKEVLDTKIIPHIPMGRSESRRRSRDGCLPRERRGGVLTGANYQHQRRAGTCSSRVLALASTVVLWQTLALSARIAPRSRADSEAMSPGRG